MRTTAMMKGSQAKNIFFLISFLLANVRQMSTRWTLLLILLCFYPAKSYGKVYLKHSISEPAWRQAESIDASQAAG
jgi:uncharacterized membrane protein